LSDGLPTELVEPLAPPAAPAVPVFPASLNGTLRSERRKGKGKGSVSPKANAQATGLSAPSASRSKTPSPVPPSLQIKDSTDRNHNALHPCIQQEPTVPDLVSMNGLGKLQYIHVIIVFSLVYHFKCT
jgi:hypothetical protein